MALYNCPTCGHPISDRATMCPNCGQPLANDPIGNNQQPPKNSNAIIIALVAVACLAIGALAALLLNRNTTTTAEPQPTSQLTDQSYSNTDNKVSTAENDKHHKSRTHASNAYISNQVYINLSGQIGGDYGATLYMSGSTGGYTFLHYSRTLYVNSYDTSSGRLVLYAYDNKGKYIGKFKGTLRGNNYSGTFTNYKGVSIKFNLY